MDKNKSIVDNKLYQQVGDLIKKLTHTSNKILDEKSLKQVKDICNTSADYMDRAYIVLLDGLEKKHSEIRYNTFQICCELFNISDHFRQLLLSNIEHILELTAETESKLPLPPPKKASEDLKRLTLQTVKEWKSKFGDQYIAVEQCYNYLLYKKKVDFVALEAEDEATRKRKEMEERRKRIFKEDKIRLLLTEMEDVEPEIRIAKHSLDSCINLLIPSLDEFFIRDSSLLDSEENGKIEGSCNEPHSYSITSDEVITEEDRKNAESRETGLLGGGYSIDINLTSGSNYTTITIEETEENSIVIENARDQYNLINKKYLPTVKKWVSTVTKMSDDGDLLKKVIDLKIELENSVCKYNRIKIEKSKKNNDSDTDSDMEEVSMSTYNVDKEIIDNLKNDDLKSQQLNKNPELIKDVTCSTLSLSEFKCKSSDRKNVAGSSIRANQNERKRKLLEIAPKLPFDIDLYHWEDENVTTPVVFPSSTDGHRFWAANPLEDSEGIQVPDGVASLRTRVIEFTGKFEPVKRSCRAPLPNGKLCPRKDRVKCPFHGLIVPRDEMGKCANPEDYRKEQKAIEERKRTKPDWQDPVLLAEIKKATGVDLKMPEKGRRKKKALENDLTDISKEKNTPYSRLSKKIFKKSSMKRVAQDLDSIDHKKFRDKYGDQFHYMHDTA